MMRTKIGFLLAGLVLASSAAWGAKDIDVEVLSRVVAKKQEELKNQLIEQVILGRLSAKIDSNEYRFLQNTVGILLSSVDKDAVQRGLVREFYQYAKNSGVNASAIENVLTAGLTDSVKALCKDDLEGCLHVVDMNLFIKSLPELWKQIQAFDATQTNWISFRKTGAETKASLVPGFRKGSGTDSVLSGWFGTPNGQQAKWLVDKIVSSIHYDTAVRKSQIDLPQILSDIQGHYAGMTYKWLEPIFDIGINYGLDPFAKTTYGFAAEKLGLKVKFFNYKYHRAENRGPRIVDNDYIEPSNFVFSSVVNDWHALVFASGLLYNVTSLPDDPSPKTAFLGAGTGLSFVNGLDVNVYYGLPLSKDKSDWYTGFVGLGFDVQVGEYLSAVKAAFAK